MNELSSRLRTALQAPAYAGVKKSVFFHPSSASIELPAPWGGTKVVGTCLRQQYYRMTDTNPTNDSNPDHNISALLGDKASSLLVYLVDTHGFQMGLQRLTAEHSFYDPRINVSGRSDLIVWDHKAAEPVGIEIKSVGEYKAGKAIERPCEEHVMQSMLYLDFYQTYTTPGQPVPKKWYIWYISRTENYTIKAGKHGSPLAMLWDYHITLDPVTKVPTIHAAGGRELWSDYSIQKIHNRFKTLETHLVVKGTEPPRDYTLEYSPERIVSLHKLNLLTRKADREAVDKWLSKGAPDGKLKVKMGDFECNLCPWKDFCWNLSTNKVNTQMSNLPQSASEQKDVVPDITDSIF